MASVTDLVLDGYEPEQVSVDTEPYTQTDGSFAVNIRFEADGKTQQRYFDPCEGYIQGGEKFTTSRGSNGLPTGFIVANDCTMVQCSKWTGTERADGSEEVIQVSGGETVTYNLIPTEEGPTGTGRVWQIKEDGKCTCTADGLVMNEGEDSCFVGTFMTITGLINGCPLQEVGSPGSLGCGSSSRAKNAGESDGGTPIAGIASGSVLGFLALLGLLLLCCCRRRKNNNVGHDESANSGGWMTSKSAEEEQAPEEKKSKGGWFRRNKKTAEPGTTTDAENPSEQDTAVRKSLFSRSNETSAETSSNKAKSAGKEAVEDEKSSGPMTFLPCCGTRA